MNKKKSFVTKELKLKVKELIKLAKKNNRIKPHTEAFKEFPVEEEVHKGNRNYYLS